MIDGNHHPVCIYNVLTVYTICDHDAIKTKTKKKT